MSSVPQVSVIVPLYNSATYIAGTIQSALAQTYRRLEIILVDDGSTDRTAEIVSDYVGPGVRYIYQENRGISAARNAGLRAARGKYIALLDHDDLWFGDKIGRQVALLESRPQVGLVYSDCEIVDAEGRALRTYWDDRTAPKRGHVLADLLAANFVPCPTAVMRMSALRKVGGFSPVFRHAEEYDLFVRIAEHYPLDYVEAPLAHYRVHADSCTAGNMARLLEEELAVVTEAFERHPEAMGLLGPRATKRLAGIRYAIGKAHYYAGDLAPARRYLSEAIAEAGYLSEPFAFHLATLLGTGFVARMRSLKQYASKEMGAL